MTATSAAMRPKSASARGRRSAVDLLSRPTNADTSADDGVSAVAPKRSVTTPIARLCHDRQTEAANQIAGCRTVTTLTCVVGCGNSSGSHPESPGRSSVTASWDRWSSSTTLLYLASVALVFGLAPGRFGQPVGVTDSFDERFRLLVIIVLGEPLPALCPG